MRKTYPTTFRRTQNRCLLHSIVALTCRNINRAGILVFTSVLIALLAVGTVSGATRTLKGVGLIDSLELISLLMMCQVVYN